MSLKYKKNEGVEGEKKEKEEEGKKEKGGWGKGRLTGEAGETTELLLSPAPEEENIYPFPLLPTASLKYNKVAVASQEPGDIFIEHQ